VHSLLEFSGFCDSWRGDHIGLLYLDHSLVYDIIYGSDFFPLRIFSGDSLYYDSSRDMLIYPGFIFDCLEGLVVVYMVRGFGLGGQECLVDSMEGLSYVDVCGGISIGEQF